MLNALSEQSLYSGAIPIYPIRMRMTTQAQGCDWTRLTRPASFRRFEMRLLTKYISQAMRPAATAVSTLSSILQMNTAATPEIELR